MSLGKPEKLCAHDGGGSWRRFVKRRTSKVRRLAEKRDPENAPVKVGRYGWSL